MNSSRPLNHIVLLCTKIPLNGEPSCGGMVVIMEVKLLRANVDNAKEIHAMQVEAFKELLKKYQDFDTNPGNEAVEKVEARLKQDFTFYYFICAGQQKAGAVRVVDNKEPGTDRRISPIFILPEFQGKGIAQKAIRLCEELHGDGNWKLETILQEARNCHLYEKMGYRPTGRTEVINERLTLIFYEKRVPDGTQGQEGR